MTPPNERPLAFANPFFKILLWIVTGAFLVTFGTMVALAFLESGELKGARQTLMEFCRYACSTTLGAIVGLFCGRGAGPDMVGRLPPADEAAEPAKKKKG
jgi:hypothetical protein